MVPGQVVIFTFYRKTSANPPVPVTGKVQADFTFAAYQNGALIAPTWAIAEIGLGYYRLTITMPATTGPMLLSIIPAAGTDLVDGGFIAGELEAYDLTTLAAVVVRPSVSISSVTDGPTSDLDLSAVANDYAEFAFTITDQAGGVFDLSGYTLLGFGLRSQDGTSTIFQQVTGTDVIITASALGAVTIKIAKTASFWTALTDGVDSLNCRWDMQGNKGGDVLKPKTLARGNFIIKRQEYRL